MPKKKPKHLEKIERIESAREHLQEAYDILYGVFSENLNVKTYFLDYLRIKISSDHGFLTNDLNIDDLIKMVKKDV